VVATSAITHVFPERTSPLESRRPEPRGCAERREARVQSFAAELDGGSGADLVIGRSPEWLDILNRVRQVAATETTVCLLGESGTGKEVVARLIHRASPRKDRPFVAINCAALPEQYYRLQ